jgi:hypothetical protein
MSDIPEDAWRRFLARYLAGAERRPRSEAGPSWTVREIRPSRFAVVRASDLDQFLPDAVFDQRSTAYMAAAVLTALGTENAETLPVPTLPVEANEVAEPEGVAYRTEGISAELTQKLLSALVTKPQALQLLLEGLDDETVERTRAYLLANMSGTSDTVN